MSMMKLKKQCKNDPGLNRKHFIIMEKVILWTAGTNVFKSRAIT